MIGYGTDPIVEIREKAIQELPDWRSHCEELQFDLVGAGVSGEPVSFQLWIVAQLIALAHREVTQQIGRDQGTQAVRNDDYFVVTAAIFIAVVGDVAQGGDEAFEYLGTRIASSGDSRR